MAASRLELGERNLHRLSGRREAEVDIIGVRRGSQDELRDREFTFPRHVIRWLRSTPESIRISTGLVGSITVAGIFEKSLPAVEQECWVQRSGGLGEISLLLPASVVRCSVQYRSSDPRANIRRVGSGLEGPRARAVSEEFLETGQSVDDPLTVLGSLRSVAVQVSLGELNGRLTLIPRLQDTVSCIADSCRGLDQEGTN